MSWFYDDKYVGCWTCEDCGFFLEGIYDRDHSPYGLGYLYCPQCGTSMADQDTDVEVVGGILTKHYECTMCHCPVDPDDNYCRQCGRRFR